MYLSGGYSLILVPDNSLNNVYFESKIIPTFFLQTKLESFPRLLPLPLHLQHPPLPPAQYPLKKEAVSILSLVHVVRLLANTFWPYTKLFQCNEITGQYIMALYKLIQCNEIAGQYIMA